MMTNYLKLQRFAVNHNVQIVYQNNNYQFPRLPNTTGDAFLSINAEYLPPMIHLSSSMLKMKFSNVPEAQTPINSPDDRGKNNGEDEELDEDDFNQNEVEGESDGDGESNEDEEDGEDDHENDDQEDGDNEYDLDGDEEEYDDDEDEFDEDEEDESFDIDAGDDEDEYDHDRD